MKRCKTVLFALAVGIVSAAVTDAMQPESYKAGDCIGNRCFDGKMWTDKNAPKGETAAPQPHIMRSWLIVDGVTVIDTSGVCLYVYSDYNRGGIAAVPKTQLPKGAGCQ